jgi:exonuclease SbcC
MLRSKYADGDTPTEVELIFEYYGKVYKIKRNPEYERLTKRGSGTTMQKADAELIYPDGRVVTKTREVTAAVNDIIGIDRNQFSRIAMIAQDDFRKLIFAPTDERKAIFRQIFQTELFQTLQDKLKAESGELNRQCENLKNGIVQYIRGVVCEEDDVQHAELDKVKAGAMPLTDIIALIDKLLLQDTEAETVNKKILVAVEKHLADISTLLGKAEEIKKVKTSMSVAQSMLIQKEPEKKMLLDAFEAEQKRQLERDRIDIEITMGKSKLPQYDELEEAKTKLAAKEREATEKREALAIETSQLAEQCAIIIGLTAEFEGLKDSGTQKEKLAHQKENAIQLQGKLDTLIAALTSCAALEQYLLKAQEKYRALAAVAESAQREYGAKNKAFLDEQAGILAESLEDGQACPVCGSTVHPCLAVKSDQAPTESELETAKTASEVAQKKAADTSIAAGELAGRVSAQKAEIQKQCKVLLDNCAYDDADTKAQSAREKVCQAITDLDRRIKEEQQNVERKLKLEEDIPVQEAVNKELERTCVELEKAIVSAQSVIEGMVNALEKISKELTFESKAQAKKAIAQAEAQKSAMEKAFNDAQRNYHEMISQIDALNGQIKAQQEQLKGEASIDVDAVNEKRAALLAQKQAINETLTTLATRISTNQFAVDNIRRQSGDLEELEANWAWVKALSNTANGNIGGKEKIMLETYIQMTYFDRIIARANIRFMVMSGGQYEMKRRIVVENNRSQSGLELDVIDHYNGTERSIKTLSGGESFKASLSLALGLSDEIQSSAGGIRLDSMFVDEGFGSLDEESLQQAMKALTGLTEGNRLVGIISHVAELKEKIDMQIVVTKDKSGGSRVEIAV